MNSTSTVLFKDFLQKTSNGGKHRKSDGKVQNGKKIIMKHIIKDMQKSKMPLR